MRRACLVVTELPESASEDSYLVDEDYGVVIVAGRLPADPAVRAAIIRKVDQAMEEGRGRVIGGRRPR